jgi:eukaryotic-like serine/threonine-protein kinase
VGTASSSKRRQFWRADWFVGALVLVLGWIFHQSTDVVETLENRFYDFGIVQAHKKPSDQIAIIAIDDQSLANIGRWPWSRDVQAQLIDAISAGKPKAIVNGVYYSEAQLEKGLPYLQKIRQSISAEDAAANPNLATIAKIASEGEAVLDADGQLAKSLAAAGNVVGLVSLLPGDARGKPDRPLKSITLKSLIKAPAEFGAQAGGIGEPIDRLADHFTAVGHANKLADSSGHVRDEALLVDYYGQMVPSMALLAALKGLNLSTADVQVDPSLPGFQIGKIQIGTNDQGAMRPFYYADQDGKSAFIYDSAFDVLSGKVPASKYAGKVVLVGPTAAGLGVEFATPIGRGMTPIEQTAHVTSSILSGHYVTTPLWANVAGTLSLLLVAAYLMWLLPRLSAGSAALITLAIFAALLIASYVALSASSHWIRLVLPAILLVIGHLALTTKRFLFTEAGKIKSDEESAETNRMMGLALQGQGQLDMAFDRFRRVPVSDALMDNIGNLALDFERKRQFNKAQAVYEYMASLDKKYKGLDVKLNRAKNLSETVILGGGGAHPGGTLLLDGGGVEKPMLGRYQVEKELGKGAMGVVYLGKDPKIGRVVAIKTMALSQEFEGEELDDARERFFREAETAGRLQHQHIVTIFDAGEEHDLAFIAMEFLKGKDLVDHCKDGALLSVPKVLSIVERVAQALAYAHRQGVVHRDIKPANIMYDPVADGVKVTDFGIARITDSSKTKTGLVLGTPSFMSPEQIAGKKVDGRSDLYSLGVMLFQMLTGALPLRGDSMAELMYKIANEDAPDIRKLRPELSERIAHIVAIVLSKRAETRFQDGDALAADLRAALTELGTSDDVITQPAPLELATAKTPMIDRSATAAVRQAPTTGHNTDINLPDFEKTVVTNPKQGG